MSFGAVPGVGGHPLFVPVFFMATAVNYLAVLLPGPVAIEMGVMADPASRVHRVARRRGSRDAQAARDRAGAAARAVPAKPTREPLPTVLLTFDRNIPRLALVSNVDRTHACCHGCVSLWRNLRHRDRVDRDLDDEVRAVFDLLVDEKIKAGLSLEQARRAATIELGREASITQQVREERAGASLDAVVKDVRYGARMLRANPGFTLVVVLSLAVGIGANSAMFSVANALLLRTLPVPEPEQLHHGALPVAARRWRRASPIRSSNSCAPASPTPDGLAAMSRVSRMRMQQPRRRGLKPPTCSSSPASISACSVCSRTLGRLLSPEDNRDHRRPSGGGHQRRLLAPPVRRRCRRDRPRAGVERRPVHGRRRRAAGFTGVWLESPVDVWIPVMMQADVRYVQNFSAENADILKPWVPQNGLRWLELLTAGRSRRRAGVGGAQRGVPSACCCRRSTRSPIRKRASWRSIGTWSSRRSRTDRRPAHAVPRAALRADGDGRAAAADRLREHRQPAAGPRHQPPARNGRAAVDRRQPRPRDVAAADREPAARRARRGRRPRDRAAGQRAAGADDDRRRLAGRCPSRSASTRACWSSPR